MAGTIDAAPWAFTPMYDAQRDRHVGREAGVREALLAVAVVQAQLHAPHLAVADTR